MPHTGDSGLRTGQRIPGVHGMPEEPIQRHENQIPHLV